MISQFVNFCNKLNENQRMLKQNTYIDLDYNNDNLFNKIYKVNNKPDKISYPIDENGREIE